MLDEWEVHLYAIILSLSKLSEVIDNDKTSHGKKTHN